MNKTIFAAAFVAACVTPALANVKLAGIFTDDMVLQRGKAVPVWGEADAGEAVSVSFAGATVSTRAAADGAWRVDLPAMTACKDGRDLVVKGKNAVTLKNVLVGDVWLVSGQSNSEMSFSWGIINGADEMAEAKNYPAIRAIKFPHLRAMEPQQEVRTSGSWKVCTQATLPGVSAMGYFFARELNRKTGVPIGILDDNWSGCCIEPFVSHEGFKAVPATANLAADQQKRLDYYRSDRFKREQWRINEMIQWALEADARRKAGKPIAFWPSVNIPVDTFLCGQYNAMIAPITRFPIAGATWYQGCSNGGEDQTYVDKLKALVVGWRKAWGYDFPFYIVQLSSFTDKTTDPAGGNGYARIRDAERRAALEIPNCGLAVTIDIGNAKDIHPKNKYDVGYRLSLWALRDVYGEKNIVVSGPIYREMKVEGDRVRVSFDHVGSGLFAGEKGPDTPGVKPTATPEGKLRGFAIAGADRKWHWADATIDGASVLVSSRNVPAPVAVRYAFRANPMGDCNLYNREGLPASPFRTDRW